MEYRKELIELIELIEFQWNYSSKYAAMKALRRGQVRQLDFTPHRPEYTPPLDEPSIASLEKPLPPPSSLWFFRPEKPEKIIEFHPIWSWLEWSLAPGAVCTFPWRPVSTRKRQTRAALKQVGTKSSRHVDFWTQAARATWNRACCHDVITP